jgi:hypothetical protein
MESGIMPQSTTLDDLLKEAIHVINGGYEDKIDWGKEVTITTNLRIMVPTFGSLGF